MTLSKVEKQIFLELIEEIDNAHDYMYANNSTSGNISQIKKSLEISIPALKRLKSLVELL